MEAVESQAAGKKQRRFGRAGLPRIAGLDLRSTHGRAFKRYYRALLAEFGPEREGEVRQIAGLLVARDRTIAETLSLDFWRSARARESLTSLTRLAAKMESDMRASKPAAEPAKLTLAERLAMASPARQTIAEGE